LAQVAILAQRRLQLHPDNSEATKKARLMTSGNSTDSEANLRFGAQSDLLSVRIIYSDMAPQEVKTEFTVASMFLGEGSRIEAKLYQIGVRDQLSTSIIWGLWFTGCATGLLVVGGMLPLGFIWASTLMLPLALVEILLLSRDLVDRILFGFDVYILLFLQIAMVFDAVVALKGSQKTIFWYCYLPTVFGSAFVDAYPAKYRALFAKIFFSASICVLVCWNFLYFLWYTGQKFNLSMIIHHVSDQTTLFVFYIRHIYVSFFRPGHFVLIKGDVCTRRESVQVSKDLETGKQIFTFNKKAEEVVPSHSHRNQVTRQFSSRDHQ